MDTLIDEDECIQFQQSYSVKWDKNNSHLILEPSKTEGGLFLGNLKSSQDLKFLKEKKITIVLDVAGQKFEYPKEIISISKSLEVEDFSDFDLSKHFQECFDYIHEHRSQGRNVLVHCQVGVSRSATIVIGYLMSYKGMGFEEAYKFVHERRSCIYPNDGFMRQLKKLERDILIKKRMKLAEKGAYKNI